MSVELLVGQSRPLLPFTPPALQDWQPQPCQHIRVIFVLLPLFGFLLIYPHGLCCVSSTLVVCFFLWLRLAAALLFSQLRFPGVSLSTLLVA